MLILIDNGHGHNTPGKRSPDGKFLEYAYNREIATRIVADLKDRGYNAQLLVPETEDIPLSERVRRINAHCNTLGKSNVILISIHVNAAGNGSQWLNATGWSCYTCKGQTFSATPSAPPSSPKTSSWTTTQTLSICRAEPANKPSSTPTSTSQIGS